MPLLTERLPQLYDPSAANAQRAYRGEAWAREDVLRGQEETKGLADKLRSLELMAISQGIALPYETSTPLPLKIQLLEDTFAKREYENLKRQTPTYPGTGQAPTITAPKISEPPTMTQPAPTTGQPRYSGGTPIGGMGGYTRQPAPATGQTTDTLGLVESVAKEAGIDPSKAYLEKYLFKPDKAAQRKALAQQLGMTEQEVIDPKALDAKMKAIREQKLKVQEGEKRKKTLIAGLQPMIDQRFQATAKATGKTYTLDTYDEVVAWINENTDWELTPEDTISLRGLKFPPGGRVESAAFEKKPEVPPAPSYKVVQDTNSPTGWSYADITTNEIKQTGAPVPSTAGEKPWQAMTEEEQIAFAKKKAEATRVPKVATYKEEYRKDLKAAIDAVSKGAPIDEVIKMLNAAYPDMMDTIAEFEFYLQQNYPAKKVK